jgi:P2-related tail formation protein
MAQLAIQPSINDVRSQALLSLIERLDAIDLSDILVYRLDSVPDSVLMLLAWQFDMLAPEWQLGVNLGESIDALTDIDILTNIDRLTSALSTAGPSDYDSLRTLLKAAIPLHRQRGTPYAIKKALSALGWSTVTIKEGEASWGGTSYPADQAWAVFRVLIPLQAGQAVAEQDWTRAIAAINFFKPVRCLLDSLWIIAAPILDVAPAPVDFLRNIFKQFDTARRVKDIVDAPAWPVSDVKMITPFYDSHFYHSGIDYGEGEPAVADSGLSINGTSISANE